MDLERRLQDISKCMPLSGGLVLVLKNGGNAIIRFSSPFPVQILDRLQLDTIETLCRQHES